MVLLRDVLKIDNGANFLHVDLHIHSYAGSHDVKDSTMTPNAIVDAAIRQGLSVIAITDHNSNANVQRAIDYAQENYPGRILVLAGVEVTTAHGHLLVYFAPERVADLTRFLARIDLIGEMGAENTRTAKSMADTIAEAAKLGGICVAAHIDRQKTGFEAFAPGFQNWKKDVIDSPGLYGLECDAPTALSWYSDADEASPAGAERKKMLEGRKAVPSLAARHHLAHVQGSDAHSMARFEHHDPSKPWSRIKLTELTFDAFRTALVDPTARVRATASVPRTVPRIHGMAVTGGFLHEEIIHFSNNLNCFIGGRGTGKSTAVRALAYAFGLNDDFGDFDSCPAVVTIFCEDENGIQYRYSRTRGGEVDIKAKEDGSINDVPIDSFRIEYFGQGELARIAENPLKNPLLLQEFLDRHTKLRDLAETEQSLVTSLRENASRLLPLEVAFSQLAAKKSTLIEIEKKLEIAEEGNLRDVVGIQSKLASEKAVRESIEAIAEDYTSGRSLAGILRNYDQMMTTAGTCTAEEDVVRALEAIKRILSETNDAVKQKEEELNSLLKTCATQLTSLAGKLKSSHQRVSNEVATKLADLRARGLAADIPGLERLLRDKTSVAREISAVEQRTDERTQCIKARKKLREEVRLVREQMTERRKSQLRSINQNIGLIIKDYTIFVKYDDAGITAEFEAFLQREMSGTYLQDNTIQSICNRVMPADLADKILSRDYAGIAEKAGITTEWAQKIVEKLVYWRILFELQVLAKQPKPIITVLTKSVPAKEIPVLQLSDGQRHTILLTIAMLAESNVPLIIDQPEDDLDNAFIFSSIVATLRRVKETRQIIIVTHNANIAVLGDSELILPMKRENDCGKTRHKGSIDAATTKHEVLSILEGGPDAFLRRKEIYHH